MAGAFGNNVDYAMLVKLYGEEPGVGPERKYSPGECVGARKEPITGMPDRAHISTSYVERMNLTMRMGMRRFTRLTNAFSRKIDNHIYALSLYFVFYNFVQTHSKYRVSPAMAAGVTERLWSMDDIVAWLRRGRRSPASVGHIRSSWSLRLIAGRLLNEGLDSTIYTACAGNGARDR